MSLIYHLIVALILNGSVFQNIGQNNYLTAGKKNYETWIAAKETNSILSAIGFFRNNTKDVIDINYFLSAERYSVMGSSLINQKGAVIIKSNETGELSKLVINTTPNASYIIRLTVSDDNNIIAKDSILYNWNNKKEF